MAKAVPKATVKKVLVQKARPIVIKRPVAVIVHSVAPQPIVAPVVRTVVPAVVVAPLPPVRAMVAGQWGSPYPFANLSLSIDKVEVTTHALPNLFGLAEPDAGTHYVLFTLHAKNTGSTPVELDFTQFNPTLQTTDPTVIGLRGATLLTDSDQKFETQPIQPGDEKTLHFDFQVPLTAQLKSLTLRATSASPAYIYDLAGVH